MDTFDANIYREYNDDLKTLSDAELQQHASVFGAAEGRVRSQADLDAVLKDLDLVGYRKHNLDLAGLSDDELRVHWVKYGRKEGRIMAIEKDYSLTDRDLEYVRNVDYRKVVKNVQEVLDRVCSYQAKLGVTSVSDLKKTKVASLLVEAINKTDKSLSKDTKRYLFSIAFPLFVDYLYTTGFLFQADYAVWREIAHRDVGLFDEISL